MALTIGALLIASPVRSQNADVSADGSSREGANASDLPVSLDRIRRELAREPQLTVTLPRQPDFRVKVERHLPAFDDVKPEPPQKQLPRTTGIDLLSLVKGAVSSSRRARAEREAHDTVDEALRQYCAAQPGNGAGITVCASAAAP
jgi:hypothetical protein